MAKRIPECRLCGHAHWSYQPHKLIGGPEPSKAVRELAAVASTVEQRTRTAQVGGSNPPRGSIATVEIPTTVEDVRRMVREINRDIESAGKRLVAIKDSDLWREFGYATWESFVEGEFPFTRRRANQLVDHERFMAAIPGPVTSEPDTNGNHGSHLTERETRAIRNDPAKVARVRRSVAQGVAPAEAIKRATSRTKDSATGAPCEHPRTVAVVVCADCGRRLE